MHPRLKSTSKGLWTLLKCRLPDPALTMRLPFYQTRPRICADLDFW